MARLHGLTKEVGVVNRERGSTLKSMLFSLEIMSEDNNLSTLLSSSCFLLYCLMYLVS